jgi:hypothetical protein
VVITFQRDAQHTTKREPGHPARDSSTACTALALDGVDVSAGAVVLTSRVSAGVNASSAATDVQSAGVAAAPQYWLTVLAAHNSMTPRYSLSNSVIFDLLVVCRPADVLQDALAQQIGIARGGKKRAPRASGAQVRG